MFRSVDAVLVRASLWSHDALAINVPAWSAVDAAWRSWLREVFAVPGFGVAIEHASPELFRSACAIRDTDSGDARRVALAVMRYLLRARGRATPFGLFAGVAAAQIADPALAWLGKAHRPAARLHPRWLTAIIAQLEGDEELRGGLLVQANTLLVTRAGHLILPYRANDRAGAAPGQAQTRLTPPVQAALDAAAEPIAVHDLAAKLRGDFPTVPLATVDRLLAGLLAQRLLVSSLRPAMTSTDPLGDVVAAAETALSTRSDPPMVQALRAVQAAISQHDTTMSDPTPLRRELARTMTSARPDAADAPVAIDTRLDATVHLPPAVADEAAQAATVLARLAPRSAASGWRIWHGQFLERYGPHALVPVTEAVDPDVGLGFPAGYRDAHAVADAPVGDRDLVLLALAQDAALRRRHEVALTEDMIARIAGPAGPDRVQASAEMMVRVRAASLDAVQRGQFQLDLVGVGRSAGSTAGRFLALLDRADRDRFAAAYSNLPTIVADALRAQISAPLPHVDTEAVARAPLMLPYVIPLSECRPDLPQGRMIALADLAVTADPARQYLVSLSRRRVVEPVMLNAVEQVGHLHPLARFLAELPGALATPCQPIIWGPAADRLPFLPALRHGKTLLCPARWRLEPAQMPKRTEDDREFDHALSSWCNEVGCPSRVQLGAGDQRLDLDLTHSAHRELVRARLHHGPATLWAAPPHDADGWIGGHAHEVVIPVAATTTPLPAPRLHGPPTRVRTHGRLPGDNGRLFLKIYGHPDRHDTVLTQHLPHLLTALPTHRGWFLRYRDPDPHLRLRLLGPPQATGAALATIADWARGLRTDGLTGRLQIDTDYPETGRFGGDAAIDAADNYFCADSTAVTAQLALLNGPAPMDPLALTAASMAHLILSSGFPNAAAAMRWITRHTSTTQTPPDRATYRQTLALTATAPTLVMPPASPTAEPQPAPELNAAWKRRGIQLRAFLKASTAPHDDLLLDVLHLHHVRAIGPDRNSERTCLHLTRATALSWLARHGETP